MPLDPNNPYNDTAHPDTIEAADAKWGCNNSVRKDGYWAPDRIENVFGFIKTAQTYVEDRSSKSCVHKTMEPNDPKCRGCDK